MKETQFIRINKEKWQRFEKLNANKSSNPEELTNLYVDITDDLGYAQSYYRHRTVRVYLNQLAQKVFWGVNKFKRDSFKNLLNQTIEGLPIAIYKSRYALLTSFIAFILYVSFGVLSTIIEPDFPRWVMGDGYVDMTIQNIEEGNPLKVYEDEDQLAMFMRITTNNIGVALLTFMAGFLLSIGTHVLLFSNGVMLGAFQYYFHTKGLLLTSFLGIWIHGAFEISAIVLAGGAGLTIGNSWLFPGNQSRLQALRNGASRGIKIMLLLVPFIVAAGFLESYVTHHYDDLPDWSKWGIILFSFALMLLTFVVWPLVYARKHPEKVQDVEPLETNERPEMVIQKARDLGLLIRDGLSLFGQQFTHFFGKIVGRFVFPIFVLVLIRAYLFPGDLEVTYFYDWYSHLGLMTGSAFGGIIDLVLVFAWIIGIGALVYLVLNQFHHHLATKFNPRTFIHVVLGVALILSPFYLFPWYVFLFFTPLLPFLLMVPICAYHENKNIFKAIVRSFELNGVSYWKSLILLIFMLLILGITMQPIAGFFSIIFNEFMKEPAMPDVLDWLSSMIMRGFDYAQMDGLYWSNIFREGVYLLFASAALFLVVLSWNLVYHDAVEERESRSLREQLALFGKRNRHQEMKHDS